MVPRSGGDATGGQVIPPRPPVPPTARESADTGRILGALPDGVFAVDLDGRVTAFNRAAEQICGTPRRRAKDRPLADVLRCDPGTLDAALSRALEEGASTVNEAFYLRRADGRQLPISVSIAPLESASSEPAGAVGTFRDLTGVFENYLAGGKRDPRGDLRKQLLQQSSFADIISRNHEMRKIFAILPEIAQSSSTVLIEGASGSGKELFARAIHQLGPRARAPLIVVNCGALPDTLLESELFGYVAGAFTDARRDKPGRFALADGGTLFLDEIGDVSPAMQVRLLRVLQDGEFEPLGSTRTQRADVRIVAATHRDVDQLVREGTFREDLYYRLAIVRLQVPALRDRREDIPLLAEHFISRMRAERGKAIAGLADGALAALMRHDFPGNVRELENAIEYAFVLCAEGLIQPHHLPRRIAEPGWEGLSGQAVRSLADAETVFLREVLARHRHNVSAAARELGVHRTTLWRRMRKLGIRRPPAPRVA